jgi:hypothetical protein
MPTGVQATLPQFNIEWRKALDYDSVKTFTSIFCMGMVP